MGRSDFGCSSVRACAYVAGRKSSAGAPRSFCRSRAGITKRVTRKVGMRLPTLFTVVCLCASPALAQPGNQLTGNSQAQNLPPENKKGAPKATPSNLQLEFRVPFDPTVFPSGPHSYLVYEMHLTNFLSAPLSLSR